MADGPFNSGCISCFGLVYIISVSLFFSSFEILNPNKIGIAKDTMTNKLTEDIIYFEGHYFLGLTKKFEEYPARSIEMDLQNIDATSSDNSQTVIDVSVQYKLVPDEIFQLYSKFSSSYQSYYESQVREVVIKEAQNWATSPDFYVNRVDIGKAMRSTLKGIFNTSHAELVGFQLRSVDLPIRLEESIRDTIVAAQLTTTTTIQQKATLKRTEAANVEAEADAEIEEIDATATATGTLIKAEATAAYTRKVTKARADALLYTARAMNLSKAEMFELLWQQTVASNPSYSKVSVGFEDTSMADNLITTSNDPFARDHRRPNGCQLGVAQLPGAGEGESRG
eukprot:CAMPEP_0182547608 /NCGR_PEP_ID=MMETSP1323-20130603/37675_1 /TAXON_ID=236787 /ORGANISM="Florenciella parvula, Strain RCC1693" /LENGTH=338 /DNA_ID=CAMNT_0024758927 /DNA_START=134 /DNA_END=1147 /DNA_ORIENTATION=-